MTDRARGILAILVIDEKSRYENHRMMRKADESAEDFAERVKQDLIKLQKGFVL